MYLKCNRRKKDGKVHRYWSIVESRRTSSGRVVQRQVLYLGEINDSKREAWRKTIEVLEQGGKKPKQLSLFPADGGAPLEDEGVVQVQLDKLSLHRPRQFGGCWLFDRLWKKLNLDSFWKPRLPPSQKGTRWVNVLKTLTAYTLLRGGSEWRLHRQWFDQSAMGDLLGEDFGLVQRDKLYRCLDKLVEHKDALFQHLKGRWLELFGADYHVLLYDLTSTYFESDPPVEGKRAYGYSRDHRGDCLQVVIALIVTPQGFPLTYEVMPGNTADNSTLAAFLERIEELYGRANRRWIMDRGIPTEESLAKMRESGVSYLVGTPKGRLSKLEKAFLAKPWEQAREEVAVKLHRDGEELYVLVKSEKRVDKEQAMRRRRFKKYWKRLEALRKQKRLTRDTLLRRIGAAERDAGRVASLVRISLPKVGEPINETTFHWKVDKQRLIQRRRREGRYLLRSNLVEQDPGTLWPQYLLLTEIEQAFKELKSDLAIRPIYHSKEERIEAHIFVAFLAYCLQVTLKNLLKTKAAGLTPRAVLESISEMQMVDVHLPTTEGQTIVLPRYTQPKPEQQLLIEMLGLRLPRQPLPRLLEEIDLDHEEPQPSGNEEVQRLMDRYGLSRRRRREKRKANFRKMRQCSGDLFRMPLGFTRAYATRPP